MKRVVRYPLLTILLMKINDRKTKLSNELVNEDFLIEYLSIFAIYPLLMNSVPIVKDLRFTC